jgi:hypothetical protein
MSRCAGLVAALAVAAGCGGGSDEVEVTGEVISEARLEAEEEAAAAASPLATLADVQEVALAYSAFWAERGGSAGPEDAEDLAPFLADHGRALDLLRRGEIVVCWEAAMSDLPRGAARTVLAYARRAPLHGGPVAFADTGAREVTAHEFAELPKASLNR